MDNIDFHAQASISCLQTPSGQRPIELLRGLPQQHFPSLAEAVRHVIENELRTALIFCGKLTFGFGKARDLLARVDFPPA